MEPQLQNMPRNNHKNDGHHPKNALEWSVFGISLLLIAGLLAYLTYQAIHAEATVSPDIRVEHQRDPSRYNPNRYQVTIYNHGTETAETVQVEFALLRDGQELETADLEIPFLPKASKREGWVNFKTDPAAADSVVARVVSYKRP